MGLIKTISRYFVYLVIINLLVIFILAISLNSLFYPEAYTKSFEKNNFYDTLDNNPNFSTIKQMIILPENSTKLLFEDKMNKIFSYVRSDSPNLDLNVTLNKETILAPIEKELEKAQVCPSGVDPVQNNQVVCKPVNMSTKEFLNFLFDNKYMPKPEILNQDTIDLKEILDPLGTNGIQNNIAGLRDFYSKYKLIKYSIIGIFILLLFILLLLYLDSIKGFVESIEIILILGGIIGIIVSLTMMNFASTQIEKMATEDPTLGPVFKSLASDVINSLSGKVLMTSIIVIFIGLLMVLCSVIYFIYHSHKKEKSNGKDKK